MIQETRIQLTDLVNKLEKKVSKDASAMDKKFTDGISKLDKKYAQEIADQVADVASRARARARVSR